MNYQPFGMIQAGSNKWYKTAGMGLGRGVTKPVLKRGKKARKRGRHK